MKKHLLRVTTALALFLLPLMSSGQTITPGTTANFVLFTSSGAMKCTGTKYLTHLTGNVGSNLPGSVTGFGNVDGVMHTADVESGQCATDLLALYAQLNGAIPTTVLATPFGNNSTIGAGVYIVLSAGTLNANLTLDAAGDPNAVFIFQVQGSLSTNSLSNVTLANGAKACNVYWKIEGALNVATKTSLKGTMVVNNALINMDVLDTLEGRALAINGAVTVTQLVAYTPIGCGSPVLTGPAAPTLVATAAYGVFASIGTVTSTPVTYVFGDVGSNSAATTGFNPLFVSGHIHPYPVDPYTPTTPAAAADLTNVYNYLVALPKDIDLLDPADFGHDLVLTPHTYQLTGITPLTGNVYLNAEGDANAVFVMKINGAFTTGTLAGVKLINGAQAKNVYWKIDGAVDVFSNSMFNGTIVANGAITLNIGDTLNGRALTINGAIAINSSYIGIPDTAMGCRAPAISGTPVVCQGGTTTLTDSTSGGKWASSNTTVAVIDSNSGVVMGILTGTTTITYTLSGGCKSTQSFTVNAGAAPITGSPVVCVGSTTALTDVSGGGVWSSSNTSLATVGTSGLVTGVAPGNPVIAYTVPGGCMATQTETVGPNAGTITGPSAVCVGSSITLTDTTAGGTWSSSNTNAVVAAGIVTGIAPGTSTISYTVTNLCGTTSATKTITVNSAAAPITGMRSVCAGSTTTLSTTSTGGMWSSSNTALATVGTGSGIVTGIAAGTPTITYALPAGCSAMVTVTVLPSSSGIITGPSNVCTGSSITLTDTVSGGTWSSSNTNAIVAGGVVTGITAGTSIISYTVTNLCGTTPATKTITINSAAAPITGITSVCVGSTTSLTDASPGGIWSSNNTSVATVGTGSGIVSGVATGTSTITYALPAGCSAMTTVTVSPTTVGTITGLSAVCVGSSIALTDASPGGVWSSSNTTASVNPVTGVVTGLAPGTDVIKYTVTNLCGTVFTTKNITVNSAPAPITTAGPATVCAGSTITLSDAIAGGNWTSNNTSVATVGSGSGIVSGVATGTSTIIYALTGGCNATLTVTVSPSNAGNITGPSRVCIGSTITLTDAVAGGTWSSSNASATVAGGIVTGVTGGIDTIIYSVTNSCGTVSTTKTITVSAAPNALPITGASSVCVGATIPLTDATTGGFWNAANATATVSSTGIVTGVATGANTISYSVVNGCGPVSTAIHAITVNAIPNSGTITGATIVCTGSSITLADAVVGGVWSSSNATATVSGDTVTGVTAGIDTISYSVTNVCGTIPATQTITVNPTPNVVVPADLVLCNGATTAALNFTGSTSGTLFSWENDFTGIGLAGTGTGNIAPFIATDNFNTPVASIITVTPSANGCTGATGVFTIKVNPTPVIEAVNTQSVCTGDSTKAIDFTGTVGGSVFNWTNSNTGIGLVASGIGNIARFKAINNTSAATVATIKVTPTANSCVGLPISFTITVNAVPAVPVISLTSPATVCDMTYFHNFGAATLPPAGEKYSWSAVNAAISDTGSTGQYALVNFKTTGAASVVLTATTAGSSCTSSASYAVNVGSAVADVPAHVIYFNHSFICLQNNEDKYTWGYDDASTLAPTKIAGEMNQDYDLTNPDFVNRNYWVEVTHNGCIQKAYSNKPAGAQMKMDVTDVTVNPNPAGSTIQVAVTTSVTGDINMEVLNMLGQKVYAGAVTNNTAQVNVSLFPAGMYLVNCYRDGSRISSTRFIKN